MHESRDPDHRLRSENEPAIDLQRRVETLHDIPLLIERIQERIRGIEADPNHPLYEPLRRLDLYLEHIHSREIPADNALFWRITCLHYVQGPHGAHMHDDFVLHPYIEPGSAIKDLLLDVEDNILLWPKNALEWIQRDTDSIPDGVVIAKSDRRKEEPIDDERLMQDALYFDVYRGQRGNAEKLRATLSEFLRQPDVVRVRVYQPENAWQVLIEVIRWNIVGMAEKLLRSWEGFPLPANVFFGEPAADMPRLMCTHTDWDPDIGGVTQDMLDVVRRTIAAKASEHERLILRLSLNQETRRGFFIEVFADDPKSETTSD